LRAFERVVVDWLQDRLKLKEKSGVSRGQPLRGPVRGGGGGAKRGSGGRWHGAGGGGRSQWIKGSVHIQTEHGSIVILQPPGRSQLRESMQWLQSQDGQVWLETDEGMTWLESKPGREEEVERAAEAERAAVHKVPIAQYSASKLCHLIIILVSHINLPLPRLESAEIFYRTQKWRRDKSLEIFYHREKN
jgi:hypothetical protein